MTLHYVTLRYITLHCITFINYNTQYTKQFFIIIVRGENSAGQHSLQLSSYARGHVGASALRQMFGLSAGGAE